MSQFPLETLTIEQVHAAMLAGDLTARELMTACLARIDALDKKGPAINAVLTVNPRALELADELDAKLRRRGISGSLHAIPILLKDNINTKDLPTTAGSQSMAGYTPPADAFVARRLREAGAIILAKVNLHEFAVWGETVSSLGGQTLNPYDLTRSPGGSSGGTGAGVAAGYGIAGLGSDTVNSVRSPASACCLVGLRPTLGLVSRAGLVPYALTQDTAGPLARTVVDTAKVLTAIAGYDPLDAATAWSVGYTDADYGRHLVPGALTGVRLGVVETLFGADDVHREVNAVTAAALTALKDLGATLVTVSDPALDAGRLVAETSVHIHELKRDLDAYLADPALAPPVKSLAAVVAGGKYHPGIGDNLKQAMAVAADQTEYWRRLARRSQLQQLVTSIIVDNRLDALVYPHQKRLVVPVGQPQVDRNGVLASIIGFPAITLPAGFSPATAAAPRGVPVGIEFLGRPWSEPLLLKLAYAFEQATGHHKPPLLS